MNYEVYLRFNGIQDWFDDKTNDKYLFVKVKHDGKFKSDHIEEIISNGTYLVNSFIHQDSETNEIFTILQYQYVGTDKTLNYFMKSKYSKMYYFKESNPYPILYNKTLTSTYKTSNQIHEDMTMESFWYILQKHDVYFNNIVKPLVEHLDEAVVEKIYNREYDKEINIEEETIY